MAGMHNVIQTISQTSRHAARTCIVAAGCAVLVPAIGAPPATAGDAPAGTIITIGGYGVISPEFEGSKSYEASFRPSFGWHKAGDRVWLDLPNDGLDFSLFQGDNYRLGVVGNLRFQRDTNDVRPRGFKEVGSVDVSIEAGAFAEYWPSQSLRTRAEVRSALFGADGLIADLSADVVLHPIERWTLTAGPRLSIADESFMDSYYSINAAQAVTSGLAQYKADAGVRSFGAGVSARYELTSNITTIGYIEYQHLTGSAGDSPLITDRGSPDQVTVGLGLKYSFGAPW
ncbi:MAG: MipA/OmpV family protein [Hyphomicrobiaceae bacterium]